MKTYVLQIKIDKDIKISIGKLGDLYFKKGYYLYTGSAKKGLEARIRRHLMKDKRVFWHIDYLLFSNNIRIKQIWIGNRNECRMVKRFFQRGFNYMNRFGCSDCRCMSHLFFLENRLKIKSMLRKEGFKGIVV